MSHWRADPGDCLICGAAHCSCGGGPIEIAQLPQRDALRLTQLREETPAELAPVIGEEPHPLVADRIQPTLPPDAFTTGTYRGKRKKSGLSSRP